MQNKQTTQNTAKQNYPGSVASYDTRPANEVGLLYNAPEPTRGNLILQIQSKWKSAENNFKLCEK